MNIEFERTIDDVIDFNLFHMTHSSSIRQELISVQIFSGLLTASLIFSILYFVYHKLDTFTSIICTLAGVLVYVLYPQISRKSTVRRIKKMLAEGDNKALLGHIVISFSPEGLFIKNQASESKINWSAIDKVAQSEKHFFFYTSSVNALVIPKDCLHSEKEKQDFLEYIDKYCQTLIYM